MWMIPLPFNDSQQNVQINELDKDNFLYVQ